MQTAWCMYGDKNTPAVNRLGTENTEQASETSKSEGMHLEQHSKKTCYKIG
jgi:hypothetical protein